MNLPLLFASLMGGCCPDYQPETGRAGYDQAAPDALRDRLHAARPRTTASTGGTGSASLPPADPADPADLSCEELCDTWDIIEDCTFVDVQGDEVVAVECTTIRQCEGGRRHAIVRRPPAPVGPDAVGRALAAQAHDEWASVHAFVALEEELRALGAPVALRARVLEAALDEVRHARLAAAAAQARGASVPVPVLRPLPPRSREAIAAENVVEAVVFETWAALRAWHQARHADPALRPLFAAIAPDETRHAILAADLDRWLRSGLDAAARARLDAARDAAVVRLTASVAQDLTPADRWALGLPDGGERERLLAGMARQYWATTV